MWVKTSLAGSDSAETFRKLRRTWKNPKPRALAGAPVSISRPRRLPVGTNAVFNGLKIPGWIVSVFGGSSRRTRRVRIYPFDSPLLLGITQALRLWLCYNFLWSLSQHLWLKLTNKPMKRITPCGESNTASQKAQVRSQKVQFLLLALLQMSVTECKNYLDLTRQF